LHTASPRPAFVQHTTTGLSALAALIAIFLLLVGEASRAATPRGAANPVDKLQNIELTELRRTRHPCVYITPADVQRAHENTQRWPWAKRCVETILKNADEWVQRSDDWLVQQMPAGGACFAYGITGCPICSSSWGTWGGARCSWDRPGQVTCVKGHVLPDAEHPDSGTGFVGKDKRIYYFVGSYNAWVVETLEVRACTNLALAYTLTGQERYAHKAAVILDALARIYPACTSGSWDYPSKPPSGRLSRPWYQVARVLVRYVDHYDQIFHSPSLDEPSLVSGLTRRQNIERNLLKNGAEYCFKHTLKGGLNNGAADYMRGVLAVGCALGIPQYVAWANEGPYGIRSCLANNMDRDGRYYETSMLYSLHARDLYLTFAEPLLNWTTPVNLYADSRFKASLTLPDGAVSCLNRVPAYGDCAPDTLRRPGRSFVDYRFAEHLYARAATPEDKAAMGSLLVYLAGGDVETARARSGDTNWLLFHAGEPPAAGTKLPASLERRVHGTDFFGREGIAMLRTGDDSDAQALLFRYGQSLNHGHLDDLNINYYALGRELTYDLGYAFGSTHTQVGWAHTTASHNLVVVNEKPQAGSPRAASGGSLLLLANTPLAQAVEAESANSYGHEGVTEYRRLVAIVGQGPTRYLLDVFRVRGGHQHDYLFHAPSTDAAISGVTLGPVEPGSLAGRNIEWGKLQLNDGDMQGHPGQPYWNPPPGNGYGFLVEPQRATTDSTWTATWTLDPRSAVRLHVLGSQGTEVITAVAPGIYPQLSKARYAIARRRGNDLSSTFVALVEPIRLPGKGKKNATPAAATFVESIEPAAGGSGVEVRLRGGVVDRIAWGDGFELRRTLQGKPTGGCRVQRNAWCGRLIEVDYDRNLVTTDASLPPDGGRSLVGQVIYFTNPAYTRNTPYRIVSVSRVGNRTQISLGDASLLLGIGRVESTSADHRQIVSIIPHEYSRAKQQRTPNGFFTGKLLRTPDGRKRTQVQDIVSATATPVENNPLLVQVRDARAFQPGDDFVFCDVQPGDDFAVHQITPP
jgi:hypothetical protein